MTKRVHLDNLDIDKANVTVEFHYYFFLIIYLFFASLIISLRVTITWLSRHTREVFKSDCFSCLF